MITACKVAASATVARDAKKEIARLEKQIEKVDDELIALEKLQGEVAFDHEKLAQVLQDLATTQENKAELELAWLEASSLYEQHSQPQ